MKKIFILLLSLSFISAYAQQWVSTAPANKKAVIEEFTGHQCTWCPAGHKIVDDLVKTNPGKVYGINIHSGSFAVTNSTYIYDFTTPEGDVLDDASGLGGYPAGSVNRNDVPWAVDRGQFATKATAIIAQPSPVNVAVRSVFDKKTGLLTTDVEVYYTGNGVGTFNRLSVFLIQDSIYGPQTGGTTNYPANYKNGQYIHNKVLRKVLNKIVGGDSILTISSGTFKKYTYVTRLPSYIKNVPVDIDNMSVVAFVSESISKILTADKSKVTYDNTVVPISVSHSDNGTVFNTCMESVTPKLTISNNSATAITNFELAINLNGIEYTQVVNKAIAPSGTENITLSPIPFSPIGNNKITISGIYKINTNANLYDNDIFMDNYDISFQAYKKDAYLSDVSLNMETSAPIVDNSNSPNLSFVNKASMGAVWEIGAESTTATILINLHSSRNNNKPNNLMVGRAKLANSDSLKFSYYYAYSDGVENGIAPSLTLSYTDDCGVTWKKLDSITCTQTGQPASATAYYIPKSSEYIKRDINISSLKGKNDVLFRLTALPVSTGNALFIDQINLKNSGSSTSSDSFYSKITLPGLPVDSLKDVTGAFTLIKDTVYNWNVDSVKIPATWSIKTVCDNNLCYDYPAVKTKDFTASGSSTNDVLKIGFRNNKIAGYGYVKATITKKGSTNAADKKAYKFSLLVSGTASVSLVSDVNEKLLYYFDNKIFVDRDFKNAQLQVVDINGRQIMDTKVSSDNIDFVPTTNGIYIATVVKDGQVAKTIKFSTAK